MLKEKMQGGDNMRMRLFDLLCKLDKSTMVWLSEDGECGFYLGEVSKIPFSYLSDYYVTELYPERYSSVPALGISILVKRAFPSQDSRGV